MKEKLDRCYKRLQELDILPTKSNMEKLLQTLYDLKEIYEELNKEGENVGRQTADPE